MIKYKNPLKENKSLILNEKNYKIIKYILYEII